MKCTRILETLLVGEMIYHTSANQSLFSTYTVKEAGEYGYDARRLSINSTYLVMLKRASKNHHYSQAADIALTEFTKS